MAETLWMMKVKRSPTDVSVPRKSTALPMIIQETVSLTRSKP